ncbi:MAG: DUF169 domain-containing protein [bacterium]|nr:DUF169 domain-containing protein [bacterium]MDE0287886.1 DUF169 domain-containing protein [bacterium]MDE0438633.1 DUF169 domain-containing protein [bacterium]
MTTDWNDLSRRLSDLLGLESAPIAMTFFEASVSPESGIDPFGGPLSEPTPDGRSGAVPAPCVFWMHADSRTFSTSPDDHGNCSVGEYTHGLVEAGDILNREDVGALLEVGWVTMEAFAGVAALERRPSSIIYGPLADTPHEPDVVLLRLSPRQAMELGDAVSMHLSGKPQCQILPIAIDQGKVALSMGCALSRARTGMADDELTCAIPPGQLSEIVGNLAGVVHADRQVVGYAQADATRF